MKRYFGILGLFLAQSLMVNGLTYSINPNEEPLSVVSDYFLSVALDTTNISTIDIKNPQLTKLVKHLSPMYFRLGGTQADIQLFEDDSKDNTKLGDGNPVLKASYWSTLYDFSKNANVRILFDLNSLLRNDDGSWNFENAEEMIKFSHENAFELDWELGNEPDLYRQIYNKQVSANQLGQDFKTLRSLLDQYQYNSSHLVGPSMFDVGSNDATRKYLADFLAVASPAIYAVTWHQYYFSGRGATEREFLNPATFNYLEQRTKVVTGIVGDANKVWLGETSSAYNGGALNMSDRFLASFLWLDKLGLGAKLGLEVIVRQAIWGYNYPLLDLEYNPNPDYWVSVLYKKLVGTKVISLENDGGDARTVRLYAHCAKSIPNAVVVFGLNLANSEASFSLAGLTANNQVSSYELTPENGDLYTKTVLLNGAPLSLSKDLNLPDFNAKIVEFAEAYSVPAYSLGFWVFFDTNVKAC
ncbi:unnamed protein product [Ceutorhynchus assimilis]|uniref:Heparanase n=1 Tax=Ceutorhynchus assimilis TaxID=467358 RepID=A0A9N9MQW5_9CUCU|nr:unnamed protein product [Ceutorhynchus assimilis]